MNGEGTQASPYQVTTADEFIEAIKQDNAYVEILNDLDFNNSKYWNIKTTTSVSTNSSTYPEHAFELKCSNINGNNFKISNIFMCDTNVLFLLYRANTTVSIDNLIFEVIMLNYNKSYCSLFHTYINAFKITFSNCDFRIKLNSVNDSQNLFTIGSNGCSYNWVNCIFNIDCYIYANITNNIFFNNSSSTNIFRYCEFNINIINNKKTSFGTNVGYIFRSSYTFYFCPIFINVYNNIEAANSQILMNIGNYLQRSILNNSYIIVQSKGTYPAKIAFTDASNNKFFDCNSTCFYDTDVSTDLIYYKTSSITNLNGLTTEQCKDASYLNSIGFFVAE